VAWLDGDRITWALGVTALITVAAAFLRWLIRKAWPWWKAVREDLTAMRNALIGHRAVLHPVTKQVVVPAEPGVGVQVFEMKDQLEFAIAKLHEIEHEVKNNDGSSLKDSVDRIAERLQWGDTRFGEMASELAAMRGSLGTLAEAQPQLWSAIEAVARAQPPDIDLEVGPGDDQPDLS
jgi:hypothetical protein